MSDLDEQEKRIAEVFGEDEALEVNQETLSIYLAYLQNRIAPPCHLTGIEDFSWEERYVFGYGSKKEYEQLKKTQPSYTDTFDFLGFDDLIDEGYGIFVNAKRVSDNKKFTLPVADLEATDKTSKNYQVLDDFSVWFANYR